jgi:Flp pilus assembly secretin CpaC
MMALLALLIRQSPWFGFWLCVALFVSEFWTAPAAGAEALRVTLDQAKVMRIPERTSTVIVGNPLIADISVQTGGMIVVTGKGYGVTNLIAMDQRGNLLLEQAIEVESPTEYLVTVHRGVERESYSCMPTCQRRITLGDTPTFFETTLLQSGRRDSQAQGSSSGNESRGR